MSFTNTKLFLMSYPKWSLIWYIFSTSGWNIECILTEFLSVNRITIKSIITLPCLLSSTFWYINIFVFNLSVQSRFQSLNLTWFIPQKIYIYIKTKNTIDVLTLQQRDRVYLHSDRLMNVEIMLYSSGLQPLQWILKKHLILNQIVLTCKLT